MELKGTAILIIYTLRLAHLLIVSFEYFYI
jgi:hypothetical protein